VSDLPSPALRGNRLPKIAARLWRLIRIPLVVYAVVVVLMVAFEESLIFFPEKYPAGDWDAPPEVEEAQFSAADGTSLHGRFLPANQQGPAIGDETGRPPVVLFAHGNAGNLSHRMFLLDRLSELGCDAMLFDYRGYGKSEGTPSEAGILQDARAARAWLAKRTGVKETDIVLMGRSVGGAVCVDLAAGDGARGLILESTFTKLPDVAAIHYPWLPVRLFMRTRLDSLSKIRRYQGPLLQSHGTQDEIVPPQLGKRLFEAAPTDHKQWIDIPGGTHNSPMPPNYYRELARFLRSLEPIAEAE